MREKKEPSCGEGGAWSGPFRSGCCSLEEKRERAEVRREREERRGEERRGGGEEAVEGHPSSKAIINQYFHSREWLLLGEKALLM
jgi:hypothetical protein